MTRKTNEIRDDELRVIGHSPCGKEPSGKSRKWLWITVALAAVAAVAVLAIIMSHKVKPQEEIVSDVFDPSTAVEISEEPAPIIEPLTTVPDTVSTAYTEHLTQIVNDIPLSIYIPHNAQPSLSIGTPDIRDKHIILVTQAADIRADNSKINGAFVMKGEPIAWGLSKKGFVSIIDGEITVGVAENTPLFEEATEKGGYFFRQYPLVDNGTLVENTPKGKAIRKAICERAGEIIVVFSESQESFHDFSQALVDFGVTNAVYLVGSEFSYGYFRDENSHLNQFTEKIRGGQKYENYIEWRAD